MSKSLKNLSTQDLVNSKLIQLLKDGICNFQFIRKTCELLKESVPDIIIKGEKDTNDLLSELGKILRGGDDVTKRDIDRVAEVSLICWCHTIGSKDGRQNGNLKNYKNATTLMLEDTTLSRLGLLNLYMEGQHKTSHKMVDFYRKRIGYDQFYKEVVGIELLTRVRMLGFVVNGESTEIYYDLNKAKTKSGY